MTDWANARRERDEDNMHEALLSRRPPPPPRPRSPKSSCPQCGRVFLTADELQPHLISGHSVVRPALMTQGREWARGRHVIYDATTPDDWAIVDAEVILINGVPRSSDEARELLASAGNRDVILQLGAPVGIESFEFCFRQADESDVEGVEAELQSFKAKLTWNTDDVRDFVASTNRYGGAREYRDGIANYLYGLEFRRRELAPSAASSVRNGRSYRELFSASVEELRRYDRPAAEAICGLVGLHFNQFQTASTKTHSPRVARVASRLNALTQLDRPAIDAQWSRLSDGIPFEDPASSDYFLTDRYTEDLIEFLSASLESDPGASIRGMERSVAFLQEDSAKLHLIQAEQCLAVGDTAAARRHAQVLYHLPEFAKWRSDVMRKLAESER